MERMSIVVPCYNEQDTVSLFYAEMNRVAEQGGEGVALPELELIFVDDGSSDQTAEIIRQLCQKDPRVRLLSFSRNFGKEAAIYAGLKAATGAYVATMDVDLQDPPDLLPAMYETLRTGEYDCVATRRVTRKGEPPIRSFFARAFYRLINRISDTQIVDGARDYRLMTRQMVDAVLSMREYNRFSKGIFSWVGFKTKWLSYENVERAAGETKWSFFKLLLYSLDGITAFSTAPLAIASYVGILSCLAALIMIVVIVVKTLVWGDPVAGYPSLVCIIMMLGGIQLLCIGILGQYLAKTYLETKRRPIYILREFTDPQPQKEADE